jgi:hypothetical protein
MTHWPLPPNRLVDRDELGATLADVDESIGRIPEGVGAPVAAGALCVSGGVEGVELAGVSVSGAAGGGLDSDGAGAGGLGADASAGASCAREPMGHSRIADATSRARAVGP